MSYPFTTYDGILYINGKEIGQTRIEPFECHLNDVFDEHRDEIFKITHIDYRSLTFKMTFNRELFYKLTGLYDWIYQNYPNNRVRHLMKYGKTRRVRKKNIKRALHIIGMLLDKER